jgi:hypothetical protein
VRCPCSRPTEQHHCIYLTDADRTSAARDVGKLKFGKHRFGWSAKQTQSYRAGLAASAADAETVTLADARSDRLIAPTREALVGLLVAAAGPVVAAPDCLSAAEAEPALTRDGCWESTTSAAAKPATRVAPLAEAEAVAPAPGRSVPDPIAAARMAVPDLVVPDFAVPASLMTPLPLDRAPIFAVVPDKAPDLTAVAGTRWSGTAVLRDVAAEDWLAACARAP